MRLSGVLGEGDRLTHADHVCWVHDDRASSTDAAQRLLAGGLSRGERLLCVGDGLADEFRAAGEPFGPLADLVERGAPAVRPVSGSHPDDRVVRGEEQRAFDDAAVRAARIRSLLGLERRAPVVLPGFA